ncbi:hypothetical protein F7725_026606, partial [Dissostichus mawsoni]
MLLGVLLVLWRLRGGGGRGGGGGEGGGGGARGGTAAADVGVRGGGGARQMLAVVKEMSARGGGGLPHAVPSTSTNTTSFLRTGPTFSSRRSRLGSLALPLALLLPTDVEVVTASCVCEELLDPTNTGEEEEVTMSSVLVEPGSSSSSRLVGGAGVVEVEDMELLSVLIGSGTNYGAESALLWCRVFLNQRLVVHSQLPKTQRGVLP